MTIPDKINTFEDEKALLLVTGKQIGKIYYASGQRISELETIEVPTPKYSDREGFFARSGKGQRYGAGAVHESKDVETKKRFLRKLSDSVKTLLSKKNIDQIYVFSPNYAIKELKEELPTEAKAKIKSSFMGNYVKFAPMKLIQKIIDRGQNVKTKTVSMNEEEKEIMKKPRKTSSHLATT